MDFYWNDEDLDWAEDSEEDLDWEDGEDPEDDDYDADDYCYECGGYGDDYHLNDDGELVCRCPECPMNPDWDEDD